MILREQTCLYINVLQSGANVMSRKITSFFASLAASSDKIDDSEEKRDAEKRKLSSTSSLENDSSPVVRQPRKKTNILNQGELSEISGTSKETESGQKMESREFCDVLAAIGF